jgi:hydroxypyruvate isomerase
VRAGDWGTASNPNLVSKCREDILLALNYACDINANSVHLMAGIIGKNVGYKEAWRTYL